MPSKGRSRPFLHPQSFAEGKDSGVTLLPHSHKHAAYRLFQVIRRIKTHPNPELLCSKSIYNFLSPLPGGESGFQAGKLWDEGMPPVQWPVSSPLPAGRAGILSGGRSLPSIGWDNLKCSPRSAGPGGKATGGAVAGGNLPSERKPGILKCCDPGLGARDEGHGDIELIERPGGHWPVSQKGR